MDKIKQVIVLRKDLNMRKGKMCAQAAHAAMIVLCKKIETHIRERVAEQIPFKWEECQWLLGSFTKIVLGAKDLTELVEIQQKALDAGLTCHMMIDNGETEFGNVKTVTAIAIGPDYSSKIDPITKDLQLL